LSPPDRSLSAFLWKVHGILPVYPCYFTCAHACERTIFMITTTPQYVIANNYLTLIFAKKDSHFRYKDFLRTKRSEGLYRLGKSIIKTFNAEVISVLLEVRPKANALSILRWSASYDFPGWIPSLFSQGSRLSSRNLQRVDKHDWLRHCRTVLEVSSCYAMEAASRNIVHDSIKRELIITLGRTRYT
jgi:hypothetical protein